MNGFFSHIVSEMVKHGPMVRVKGRKRRPPRQFITSHILELFFQPHTLSFLPFPPSPPTLLWSQALRAGCLVNVIHNYGMEVTMCLGPSMLPTFNRHGANPSPPPLRRHETFVLVSSLRTKNEGIQPNDPIPKPPASTFIPT